MLLSVRRKTADAPECALSQAPLAEPLVIEKLSRGEGFPVFDLTVPAGSCVAVSGPSGGGKSMLLRLIADLDPGQGTARIGPLVREVVPANEWRRTVIYVPADSGWWTSPVAAHMSDQEGARRLLAELDLPDDLMNVAPENTSSGERQRLALIRAFTLRPRFLLLDEPTAALDPATTLKVEKVLARAKQDGMGLLVVSHDPEQIARIANRHLVLSETGLTEVAA